MSKIIAIIGLPLSIMVVLQYFEIYDVNSILPIDIYLVGAIALIALQALDYFLIHTMNQGTTIMGKIIKAVFAVPGILYVINLFYSISLPIDLEIIIALFLFTEGVYTLH